MKNEEAKFIEASLRELGLTTDKELEAIANLAPNTLSKARQGAQELSAFAKLKILDLRGYKLTVEGIFQLFGAKGQEWIESENRRRLKRAKSKIGKGE